MLSVMIKKQLGSFRLDVSFDAGEETMALLGVSGCGKSLALRCIAGIDQPDEGRIILNGRVLFDSSQHVNLTPQQRRVGYLFQNGALFPNMTVAENIAFGVHLKDKRQRAEAVSCQIGAMQLRSLEHRRPNQLSGGQQQRVALARILASEPELLLLDEPFSALDEHLRGQLELDLAETLSRFGRTTLLVTHSRGEVRRLADSVCVIEKGRSEPRQSVRQLFEAPATLASSRLAGCQNFSRLRHLGGCSIEALDWGVELTATCEVPPQVVWLGIHARQLKLAAGPGLNTLTCRIERVIEDLSSTVVILRTGGQARLRLETDPDIGRALSCQDMIHVQIRPQDILLLTDQDR